MPVEMEDFSDVWFKQRAVIEFLTAGNFPQLRFTDECKQFVVINVLISLYPSEKKNLNKIKYPNENEYSKTLGKVVQNGELGASRFQKQKPSFFKDGLQKLVQRWRKRIEVRGDFVEK